ncbi:MAG: hypothetical protein KJ709_07300 [Nanoarchaeota archaeon]|nr:hypothetical protein [Nanoarchaeota archaeon]
MKSFLTEVPVVQIRAKEYLEDRLGRSIKRIKIYDNLDVKGALGKMAAAGAPHIINIDRYLDGWRPETLSGYLCALGEVMAYMIGEHDAGFYVELMQVTNRVKTDAEESDASPLFVWTEEGFQQASFNVSSGDFRQKNEGYDPFDPNYFNIACMAADVAWPTKSFPHDLYGICQDGSMSQISRKRAIAEFGRMINRRHADPAKIAKMILKSYPKLKFINDLEPDQLLELLKHHYNENHINQRWREPYVDHLLNATLIARRMNLIKPDREGYRLVGSTYDDHRVSAILPTVKLWPRP